MPDDMVDENAGQIYSLSGAKVVNKDGKYVFSHISAILKQIVSMMPWVSQYKREKDAISQAVSMDETISQIVATENGIKQVVTMEVAI